ncbi:MAG: glycosyltransferase family 2 protein [Eubacteriales bacterium]|nr:glycosyltransferase family 2 protein [Eubacteriales bacterium]
MNMVVLIPSYKPDEMLCQTVRALRQAGFPYIYVVNDGSPAEHMSFFDQARSEGCVVLHHAVNMGKGRALRTGFNQILLDHPGCVGVVACDADGQHEASAVLRAAQLQLAHPDCVILGARRFFQARVPILNLLGNSITRLVFFLLCGLRFGDTQCGLRSYPLRHMATFAATPGDRFEFENMMLLDLRRRRIGYVEYPMKAVYEEVKRVTHFNKLVDSVRIYSSLLRFAVLPLFAGLLSALVFASTPRDAVAAFVSLLLGWVPMALSCRRRWLAGATALVLSALGALLLQALTRWGCSALEAWWLASAALVPVSYTLWLYLRYGRRPRRIRYPD